MKGASSAPPRRRRKIMAKGKSGMSGWRIALTLIGAMLGLLLFWVGGCGLADQCSCPAPANGATIDFSCLPTAPPVVKTTGPCSVCPPVPPNTPIPGCAVPENSQYAVVTANGAGLCHVELTFGNGATSSVDLDFTSHWTGCGSDPHGCGEGFIAVTADGGFPDIQVSLPGSLCDAGHDGEASD
jgi:hypothetical protein